MDTNDLTNALREATTDLEPRYGFTTAVLRGGRRRTVRRRMVIATSAATMTAIAASGTYVLWPDAPPGGGGQTQVADERLDQPSTGDLRSDTQFLNDATRAWREGLPKSWNANRGIFADLRGEPHVYWAGNTAAGPVAVVMQEAFFPPHENLTEDDWNKQQTLVGLVAKDPADGVLKLVYDQYQSSGNPPAGHFRFGKDDRMVLIVDRGTPLFWAPAPKIADDATITRDWQPLEVKDGVAILQIPEGSDPKAARVLARQSKPAPNDNSFEGSVELEPSAPYLDFVRTGKLPMHVVMGPADDSRLQWFDEAARIMRTGRAYEKAPEDLMQVWDPALEKAGMLDPLSSSKGYGLWFVLAGLPDGRAAVLSELQEETQPSRIFTVLLKPDGSTDRAIAGAKVDRAAVLPVKVQMPDGQGWVVANYGATLRYRVGADGPWQDAGKNAALLPDNATQVEVTKGGAPQVITLTP